MNGEDGESNNSLEHKKTKTSFNVTFLKNQHYDEAIEIEQTTEPSVLMSEAEVEDLGDVVDKVVVENSSAKVGTNRPTSRPPSHPPSRPSPSARVRALGKGDLEEIDQNSPDDDDDEEEDDDDDEEDEQGIHVEGYHRTSFLTARPKSARLRYTPSKQTQTQLVMSRTRTISRRKDSQQRDGAISPDITAGNISFTDELGSITNGIIFSDVPRFIMEERDRLHAQLPYGGTSKRAYDPADFENLPASAEVKELFQYITRYTPQTIELLHKLRPFIPDFIPAVGDIDAFIKVPTPDGQPDKLGLNVLDEPCAKQSDPTVLDLQLRAITKESTGKAVVVKSLKNADKRPKEIDSWITSIGNLHRSKPPPTVHYARNMPDIETLMQEWPQEFEELLKEVGLPSADLDCSLEEYVSIICSLLDIPVHKSKVQSLHVLFTLYSEFKNSQHFKALAMENTLDNSLKAKEQEMSDHLIIQ